MSIKDFIALHLKGSEHIKITLRNGKVLMGILLNDYLSVEKILIYNYETENVPPEEYIKLEVIRDLKVI